MRISDNKINGGFLMFEKILVGYDGSTLSDKAVQEVKKIVHQNHKSEVHFDSAIELTVQSTNMMIYKNITNEIIESAEKQLEEINQEFNEVGKEITTKIFMSEKNKNPGENICNYAEQNDISLIVIGSRGLGNLKGLFLGSVSNEIVQKANVPVLVMKDD